VIVTGGEGAAAGITEMVTGLPGGTTNLKPHEARPARVQARDRAEFRR
jgi:hypothetical protein